MKLVAAPSGVEVVLFHSYALLVCDVVHRACWLPVLKSCGSAVHAHALNDGGASENLGIVILPC